MRSPSTVNAMNPPLPVLLQRTSRHDHFPIADAWAIALAWRTPLQGKVRLVAEGATVHKSYEWVDFVIPLSQRDQVSAARAAALTWFALSCCRGYSGRENPVFWKCVFSELVQPPVVEILNRGGLAPTMPRSVTDAYSFFDRDGAEFPRFRVQLQILFQHARLFIGLPGEQLMVEDADKLAQIMEQLAPWIEHKRTMRQLPVSFDMIQLRHYVGDADEDVQLKICRQDTLLRLLSDVEQSTSAWPAPTFSIVALHIEGEMKNLSTLQLVLQRLNQYDIDISLRLYLRWYVHDRFGAHDLAAVVRCVLPPPSSSHTVKTRSLSLASLIPPSLPAFLSALPYTVSVHSIKVSQTSLGERALAWLAYALFHPDTPSSSWKSLTLSQTALTDGIVAMLEAMARGNNVAALLHGDKQMTSDGYYRATLAHHTTVYDQPVTSLWKHFTVSWRLTTTDASTTVEVSGVSTDDPTQWDEWVPVVVPGYGLGWVLSANVTHVEKRRPAKAALAALCLDSATSEFLSSRALNTLLHLVGQRLMHLEMSSCRRVVSAADLRQALANCPSLESLVAPFKAGLWNDDNLPLLFPQLRELQLCENDSSTDAQDRSVSLSHLPRSLQVLRIDTQAIYPGNHHPYASIVQQLLLRPSQLRVLHWQDGLRHAYLPTPYAESCADTQRRLDELGIASQWRHVTQSQLPASCAAAFLSVTHAQRMDLEVVKTIIAFAGSRVTRWILLEPQASEIPEERRWRLHP